MGCVSSKLNESISRGEEEIKYRGFAGPNHLVCLTSTTYGVFNNSCNRESRSSPVEATEVVETINAWELMDGLEDESPGPSPAVEKGSEKVGSLKRSVDALGGNRMGKSLGGSTSPMGQKKLGLDKENERPKQGFGPAKPNGVSPVAPLKERSFVGKENFGPRDGQYNNMGSVELAPDIVGSTAPCDEPLHKGRISCDVFWDCVGKENFQPSANEYSVPIGGLACKSVDSGTSPHCSEYSHRTKGRISHGPLTELRIESSRHFDFCDGSLKDCIVSSTPLFDPEMLASFETSLDNFEEDILDDANSKSVLKKRDPLEKYEEKCPPGGQDSVILYTTTLRGIRKTFEDCNNVRCVLESYGICFIERDVSMHLLFRNELEKLMGWIVPVPRLFIKGRYIGSAGEVLELHEEGRLGELLEGIPADDAQGRACDGCGGVRFVPCLECSGSCKLLDEEDNTMVRCPDCNENGLIQCPICC
ncbi:hypothetical protein SUGI_0627800 [Cryptomeria japonica]|nr:hypothetical protein SUGI_0627800 [Cryptomeria japonica]